MGERLLRLSIFTANVIKEPTAKNIILVHWAIRDVEQAARWWPCEREAAEPAIEAAEKALSEIYNKAN